MPNQEHGSDKTTLSSEKARQYRESLSRISPIVILAVLLVGGLIGGAAPLELSYGRPYLMPASERGRIQRLITSENWARDELKKVRALATSDGYSAALLYALEGDESNLATAKKWLMQYGRSGGDLGDRALKADQAFFRQGQPWLGDVYYLVDHRPLVAYDWVHSALSPLERETIESGIVASAMFRMKAMDRWTQTPNLVFKPTFMVAVAGLVTGNQQLIDWGFNRNPGSAIGGYYSVIDAMLEDSGPWAEAPLYAIAHKPLLHMLRMSRLLQLYDGTDWFRQKSPRGGSPQALLQYYIDTAYPIERTGFGRGQIRIATYGDGATSPTGDLFFVNPAGPGLNMHEELAEAYGLSGDPMYAGFLSFVPDYEPTLFDRAALPSRAELPSAPSRVWPNFGVAMLRSEESPAYWSSNRSIAVLQRMTQDYGHGHRDAFTITLHGAGRLLYPDYNFIQYENPALGWTRNSIAHNTVVVDGKDSENAKPTAVRHDFSPDVKFLATSASGVFAGVDQTRALMLTPEYLLDLFHVESEVPHTYDYLLHSFGRPNPTSPKSFADTGGLGARYAGVQNQRTTTTDKAWAFEFVLDEEATRKKERAEAQAASDRRQQAVETRFGDEWYKHRAAVRVTMAGAPNTRVTYGVGPDGLTLLAGRRSDVTDSVFVATHEPFVRGNQRKVTGIKQLTRTKRATVARVRGRDFTDYGAVGLGPQHEEWIHVLADKADRKTSFAFKDYGYLRVDANGRVTARGEWVSFSIPRARGPVTLNGKPVQTRLENGYLVYGSLPRDPDPTLQEAPVSPLVVTSSPTVVRMLPRDHRSISFRVTNPLNRPVSGYLDFTLPEELAIKPSAPKFGPIAANGSEQIFVRLYSDNAAAGAHTIPYRIAYQLDTQRRPTLTRPGSLKVAIGPVLELVYPGAPQRPVYLVYSQRYTAKADMFAGLFRYLADDDGIVRLDGDALFTFSDGKKALLFEGTKHAFTWPVEAPAQLTAHAYDRCRWQALFFADRIMVRMVRDWTQFERAHFTILGKWVSPRGSPQWRTVLSADGSLDDAPSSGSTLTLRAAELSFPGANWNLCFDFIPAQRVTFNGTELKFSIGSLRNDQWTVGFCRPGSLESWRWK